MSVVTRQRALREGYPILSVGDAAWYVPRVRYTYGPHATSVRLLGGGRVRGGLTAREVSVLVLADTPVTDSSTVDSLGDQPTAIHAATDVSIGDGALRVGSVLSVPDVSVGPDALRDHITAPAKSGERYRIPPQWALDLFCPVHGYIHGYPNTGVPGHAPIDLKDVTRLCAGAPLPRPPLAGDAVRLAGPSPWTDEVATGDLGVVDGMVGEPIATGVAITFHASTFRDDHVVSCSGGPATIATSVEELVRTDETVEITVWEWRDGIAGAHNGVHYRVTVPVWDWYPTT
jgi:hypothetical protein